jgi:hypothetical protein
MVNKFLAMCLVSALAIMISACGGAASNSKWTAKDKENAVNGCKLGKKNADPAKAEKFCGCYLEKVMALSPDPVKQGEIPMDQVRKLNDDCYKEAGL